LLLAAPHLWRQANRYRRDEATTAPDPAGPAGATTAATPM
jgi:hypothetical protein